MTRWGFLLLFTVLNAYLVLNQIGYHIFFTHLHPNLTEGQIRLSSLADVTGSALAEADWLTVLNIPLILSATVVIGHTRLRTWLARCVSKIISRERPRPLFVGVYLGGLFFAATNAFTNYNLEHHPVLSLFLSPPDVNVVLTGTEFAEGLPQTLVFGQYEESAQTKEALQRVQTEIRTVFSRPNVILVVLESVGSKQVFQPDGQVRFDPQLTPNLAQLSQNSVIFDSIYTTFPATVRAHMPLATGGQTVTWGSVFQAATAPFVGPTLPRVLKKRGYQTGFVSSGYLSYENLDRYMASVGFDYLFGAEQLSPNEREQHSLNSWGVAEEVLHDRAINWIDTVVAADHPFFLQLLTVATHHPYSTPADYPAPFAGDDRRSRYWNALHYTDAIVGRLIDELAERRLLEETLIFVTGDHGEAFGQLHDRNFTHKNYLYEENVKTFLMISSPRIHHPSSRPLIVRRIGSLGDIMPTVLSLTGSEAVAVSGQDLFSPVYKPRPVFFHKFAPPELWGLRDGHWKFIATKIGEGVELYDLEADPDEQVNIAPAYPARIQTYRQLCTQWYLTQNADYVALLR